MYIKVTKELGSSRISKKLPSGFIELGYGLQAEAMSAQMFFNRSFEPFLPYRGINKYWFDLLEDENDYNSPYETDWSVFDWYHSGYEHNAWFAFPGRGGALPITDESTFLIEKSPDYNIFIGYEPCNYHGQFAMKVVNESSIWGGLAQDGKYCFESVEYNFRGAFKSLKNAENIRMEIYDEQELSHPIVCIDLKDIQKDFSVKEAVFKVPKEGRYTFVIAIPPNSQLLCDDFSLVPSDHIGGWKKSTIDAAKYVAPRVVRWPGGCFASFYDWHEGIGSKRKPDYSYFWGGYNYNDVGTDEFGEFIHAIGADGMICVNLNHPYKKYYEFVPAQSHGMDPENDHIPGAQKHHRDMAKFSDLEKGAQEAANWVEYCNGDASTTWGAIRARHGHEVPFGIKYWEMDNETFRWFDANAYAKACVIYSRKMKAVDPTIKIGMDTYSHPLDALDEMLDIAGKDIDFLADRVSSEDEYHTKIEKIRVYNEKHGTCIKYCDTEWLALTEVDVFNMIERKGEMTKTFMFSKWFYALNAAKMLMMWQRDGDTVDFICFNNMANTHSQSTIETPKEGAYVTAAGEILHMFAHTKAAYVLKCKDYQAQRTDDVQVQVSLNEAKDALVINGVNSLDMDREIVLDVEDYLVSGQGEGIILQADHIYAMNTLTKHAISKKQCLCVVKDGKLMLNLPKLSFLEYVIRL